MPDPTQAPAAPTPGSAEYNAAMAAKFDATGAVVTIDGQRPATAPAPAPAASPAAAPARPAWLPTKFSSAEDLAKAYAELERSQSQRTPATPAQPAAPAAKPDDKSGLSIPADPAADPATTAAQEATAKAGLDFEALMTEYTAEGALKAESYQRLEQAGIPKTTVDAYIAGQVALAEKAATDYKAAAFTQAGGEAKFAEMQKWAAVNLTPAEKVSFNEATSSGDTTKLQLAVANLRTRFEAGFGTQPTLLAAKPSEGSVAPYESVRQMTEDMRRPEYKRDPAFRAKVEARISASNLWSVQERS